MSSLHVSDLTKSFGALRAVDGVSLHVPEASVTAVLGPSGCGKTTLLRMIAGFLDPDGGTIAFGDHVVAQPGKITPPQRRRVGYVPQEGALFPHLSVADNIGFGLPRAERSRGRVSEMLDLVELPREYAVRQPHQLSGGQQQRVALARALAPAPALVLLDEPFSSLDAALRVSTGRAVVRALQAAGTTAVLVTHDQDEALSLTDQVAVMRAGKVVQAGTPREVYQQPADAGVARFVGGALLLSRNIAGRLLSNGHSIDGDPTHEEVLVRPEQVSLSTAGPGLDGVVQEVSYYGHDASVRVLLDLSQGKPEDRPEDKPEDKPEGQPLEMVARVVGSAAPDPGSRVKVAVIGDVRAL